MMYSALARYRKWFAIGLIGLLMAGVFISQEALEARIRSENLPQSYGYVAGHMIGGIVLAGFKGIAVDILWVILDDSFHRWGWYKVLPLFYTIGYLQPQFILNWSLGAWHMAFNISHQAKNPDEKRQWILSGIDFGKKGITFNPERYELYFETGWIYYQKAQSFDEPVRFYDEAIRYMRRALRYEHPDYLERIVAHIYRKSGRLERAIEEYERALSKKPDDTVTLRNLQDTRDMLANKIPVPQDTQEIVIPHP